MSWPPQKRNWQDKDILFRGTEQGNIVLVKRLLENPAFRGYYCEFMAWFLQARFTPEWFSQRRDALWKRLEQSVYLESQTPSGPSDTARPWTNDEVYRHAVLDQQLDASGSSAVAGLQRPQPGRLPPTELTHRPRDPTAVGTALCLCGRLTLCGSMMRRWQRRVGREQRAPRRPALEGRTTHAQQR